MDEKVKKILDKAHKYIFELGMCIDDEVFNASTLSELGKYFFTKTIQSEYKRANCTFTQSAYKSDRVTKYRTCL